MEATSPLRFGICWETERQDEGPAGPAYRLVADALRGPARQPQNIMSTAHKLDVAEDVANVLFPILEEKFGFQTYRSFGRKEAFHEGGSRWRVVSSGESAGHGTSNDLVVVDEIWNVKPEVIEGGLLPTQTARPAPFAFFTSTAGRRLQVLHPLA